METTYERISALSDATQVHSGLPRWLTPEQTRLLARLDRFEAPYLEEKLLEKGVFGSREDYRKAFDEFKKYVGLVGISGKRLGMTSRKIDEVWHQFILFTQNYHQFCDEFLGYYLHHTPKSSYTPLNPRDTRNLIQAYREIFGEAPQIWEFERINTEETDLSSGSCSGGCGGCSGCA